MNILFFGDIFGKPGRRGLIKILPDLKLKYSADFVIANAENLSHGVGVSEESYNEIINGGVDFLTSGNHIFAKKEARNILERQDSKIIRPANFPPTNPGRGYKIIEVGAFKVLAINLVGRLFIKKHYDCPFRKLDEILADEENQNIKIKIIDFHAEATSEKLALAYYADGKVSAVIGTHTHIPTADPQILPQGTFYITDIGMVGPKESILGIKKEAVIEEFITQMPVKTSDQIAERGLIKIDGIFLEIDNESGKVKKFEQILEKIEL